MVTELHVFKVKYQNKDANKFIEKIDEYLIAD